jgi:hypothetical protein
MNFQASISRHQFPGINFQASISRHEFHFCFTGDVCRFIIHMAAMTPPIIGIIGIVGSAWQCKDNAMQ